MKNNKRKSIAFNEDEINLALEINEKLTPIVDMLSYMLSVKETKFNIILLTANYDKLEEYLRDNKRDSDILKEINSKQNIYAIVCQETEVDGGYMFAKRLMLNLINDKKITDAYSSTMEIRTTKHQTKEMLYKLFRVFISSKRKDTLGSIVFHSI
jgi:hypothetical protein